MLKSDFQLKLPDRETLDITAYGDECNGDKCLIFIHGFKGFKDWGFFPYAAEYLAMKGFFVLTFNFSHNGIGKNPVKFTELDKFAKNTYSREVSESNEMIDAYLHEYFCIPHNPKIGLLGHSRGGAISLLTASERNEVKSVALWASLSKLDRYSERQKEEWRKNGFMEVLNQRTNQLMRMNASFLDDMVVNSEKLNLEKAIRGLNRPLFIAHGEQDLAVPISEGLEIYNWSNKGITEFYKIEATGHTFDIRHPFESSNNKFDALLEKTSNFFMKTLN